MSIRLAFLAVLAIGCHKPEPEPPGAPDLQLVSKGNEPRRALHYQVPKGTRQTLELAIDAEVSAGEMGGPMPTIVVTLSVEVTDIVPTGMKLRTTVVDAIARDKDETRVPTAALAGPLEQMKGIVMTSTMTPNGRMFGTTLDLGAKKLPDSAKQQLAALSTSIDQLAMPLPDDPIGVGAVWRNSKPLEQNGMKMIVVNSVEVTALTGEKLSYSLDTQVHGADQTLKQGDLSVDITDITGTGSGKGTVDLHSLAFSSELSQELRSSMQAAGEGSATPMTMTIATRVTPK